MAMNLNDLQNSVQEKGFNDLLLEETARDYREYINIIYPSILNKCFYGMSYIATWCCIVVANL